MSFFELRILTGYAFFGTDCLVTVIAHNIVSTVSIGFIFGGCLMLALNGIRAIYQFFYIYLRTCQEGAGSSFLDAVARYQHLAHRMVFISNNPLKRTAAEVDVTVFVDILWLVVAVGIVVTGTGLVVAAGSSLVAAAGSIAALSAAAFIGGIARVPYKLINFSVFDNEFAVCDSNSSY
ncbi:MAG: hypothetical protein HFF69_11520 [Oscillospiraceae bacterium]|nr:hypothetical protein [Oscillospiraceae bacterium]